MSLESPIIAGETLNGVSYTIDRCSKQYNGQFFFSAPSYFVKKKYFAFLSFRAFCGGHWYALKPLYGDRMILLLVTIHYFWKLFTTFGNYSLLLVSIHYFWYLFTSFGDYSLLLVTIHYFW